MQSCAHEYVQSQHCTSNWRAKKKSGLTQYIVLEIAWIAQICNKKMHTLPVFALNFEILKFSAAPETHFKGILLFGGGGANSTFVGYTTCFNCPMFTSTKVACLHFARYNSVCYILNYLVLIRMLLHYGEPIVLMKVLHFCAFIFKLIFHLQVLLCSLLWTSLTIEVHSSSVTEACWGHCNVQWYKVQTCSLQLSYCIYSLSWIFYWHRHMSSPCIYIIRVWQQIHFSRYS